MYGGEGVCDDLGSVIIARFGFDMDSDLIGSPVGWLGVALIDRSAVPSVSVGVGTTMYIPLLLLQYHYHYHYHRLLPELPPGSEDWKNVGIILRPNGGYIYITRLKMGM